MTADDASASLGKKSANSIAATKESVTTNQGLTLDTQRTTVGSASPKADSDALIAALGESTATATSRPTVAESQPAAATLSPAASEAQTAAGTSPAAAASDTPTAAGTSPPPASEAPTAAGTSRQAALDAPTASKAVEEETAEPLDLPAYPCQLGPEDSQTVVSADLPFPGLPCELTNPDELSKHLQVSWTSFLFFLCCIYH